MAASSDTRKVGECDAIQAKCRRGRLTIAIAVASMAVTIILVIGGGTFGFALSQRAKDATQDADIQSLEKGQDRIFDQLDRIEDMVRSNTTKGNGNHGGTNDGT